MQLIIQIYLVVFIKSYKINHLNNNMNRNRMNDNFDDDLHKFNIQRRIMERDFTQADSDQGMRQRNNFVGMNRQSYNDDNGNFGEITGEVLDGSQLDKGMPFRPKMTIATERFALDEEEEVYNPSVNPHLDFNLFERKPNIKVSYFDPLASTNTIGYSSVQDEGRILDKLESQSNEKLVSESIDSFTFDFIDKFTGILKTKKSLILSPFNIMQSFCLLYIGSKNNTEKELANYFQLPNKKTTYNALYKINQEMAKSKSFSQLGLVCIPNYVTLNEAYVSYISKLGYFMKFDPKNARMETNKINNLISQSTNNMIKNIIDPGMLNGQSSMNLINTMFFYSRWKHPFPMAGTRPEIFNGINKRHVHMMTQQNETHRYFEDNHHQLLEMDYIDGLFTMGFLLPKSQYAEPMMTHAQFEYYMANLSQRNISIIKIPKFKQESKYRIDNFFRKFGPSDIFNDADISDIIPPINGFPVYISEIIHTAVILVDEAGTKAAAATVGSILKNGSHDIRAPKVNFIADHQFLYYIRYKPYNTIIFIGQHY